MTDEHVTKPQLSRAATIARTRMGRLRDLLVTERLRGHLSQQWIADQIGIARSTLADFERIPDRSASWIAFAYAVALDFDIHFVDPGDCAHEAENPDLKEIPAWEEVT